MGLSCHVEAVVRGPLDAVRADELAADLDARCAALDWYGGQRFAVSGATLRAGHAVSTKVARDAEADDAWTVMCQCIAAALWLSRRLRGWRFVVSDDLELIATSFELDELAIEDGRVCGEAGVHASVLGEVGGAIGEEARWHLLEDPASAPAAVSIDRRPIAAIPDGEVLAELWLEPSDDGERAWVAVVPLHNVHDVAVDVIVELDLRGPHGDLFGRVGVRWLGAGKELAPGERRRVRLQGTATLSDPHWVDARIRYLAEVAVPVERLQVTGVLGDAVMTADAPAGARVRAPAATVAIGAATAKGEYPLAISVDLDVPVAATVAPRLRFDNAAGSIIRTARGKTAEVGAGASTLRFATHVRRFDRLGPVTCTLEASLGRGRGAGERPGREHASAVSLQMFTFG